MRNKFNELFYIPRHGKMHEKTFFARIAVSVCIIVIFLSAMGFTAYAWFSADVTSSLNKIATASYNLDIVVKTENEEVTINNNSFTAAAGESYEVTLRYKTGATAQTGFCIVKIGETEYHTKQISAQDNAETAEDEREFTFYITANEEALVTFTPCWGTSSKYANAAESPNFITYTNNTVTVGAKQSTPIKSSVKKDGEALEQTAQSDNSEVETSSEQASSVPTESSKPQKNATVTSELLKPENTSSEEKRSSTPSSTSSEESGELCESSESSEYGEPEEPEESSVPSMQ